MAEAGNTANLSFKDLTGIAVESVYGHLETGKLNPCYILVKRMFLVCKPHF